MSNNKNQELVKKELDQIVRDSKKYLSGVQNDCNISFPGQFSKHKQGSYEEWVSKLSVEEIQVAALRMSSILWGNVVVLPQICRGLNKCVHSHVCPFSSNTPDGKACPMEQAYIVDKMSKLKKQFDVSGLAETEFMLLNKLVELDLYDLRINSMLAKEQTQSPLVPRIAAVTADGVPLFQDEINPLFELKEKIGREKSKLLTTLVGTPQERYKKAAALKEKGVDNISELNDKLSKLLDQVEDAAKGKIKNAEIIDEKPKILDVGAIEEDDEIRELEDDFVLDDFDI